MHAFNYPNIRIRSDSLRFCLALFLKKIAAGHFRIFASKCILKRMEIKQKMEHKSSFSYKFKLFRSVVDVLICGQVSFNSNNFASILSSRFSILTQVYRKINQLIKTGLAENELKYHRVV